MKDQFSFYSKFFIGLLIVLAGYALTQFHQYMDGYEISILIGSVFVFSWLGFYWTNFKNFFIAIFLLAFLSIFLYQGNLSIAEENFFLKYFISSQSAIMWMSTLYPLSLIIYWIHLFNSQAFTGKLASNLVWIATTLGTSGLLIRWYESYLISVDIGHIPISNLYEVFVLFCLITSLIYIYYEEKIETKKLGSFIMIIINIAVGFLLWYSFAKGAHEIQPLVPALQSYWMKIHVPANFIGYGSFAIAAMVSMAYLIVDKGWLTQYLPNKDVLEDMTYRVIAIGFLFFTIATILGAVWAAEAWGGYWSWDPKETWALIVWLNYAAWLHLRLIKGLRGSLLAWWSIIGLFITAFCFLGVNLFLSGPSAAATRDPRRRRPPRSRGFRGR
jgi:cytochrome c-type biogenesis protein CcsB